MEPIFSDSRGRQHPCFWLIARNKVDAFGSDKIATDGASHFEPRTFRAGADFRGRDAFDSQHGLGDSPHLLIPKLEASYYFGIASNDDQRQPDAKDKLREAFAAANLPAKIEVYEGCQHGWCVSDGMVYNKAGAERAYGEMTALYRQVLV